MQITELKNKIPAGAKVVFVSGNFNVVHPGHLRLLEFASECGDYLVVGVLPHSGPTTLVPEALRLAGVRSIGFVDHAILMSQSPDAFIRELKPDVVVKGREYENVHNEEQAAVDSYGGRLLFGSGDIKFSSRDLLYQEFHDARTSLLNLPMDFPERHGFTFTDLKSVLTRFKGLRVGVIGDTIVDQYVTCDPLGMSQEDPTIVVTPVSNDQFIGGAAIVAAHARGLGADVQYLSVVGEDDSARFVESELSRLGVRSTLVSDESRPTTLKQRFRARGKTLLRVSHLRQHAVSKDVSRRLSQSLKAMVSDLDVIIFSDFNYGCLPQSLVESLSAYARDKKVRMVADSQSSSQIGDVSRFKGMTLLTPTEREARLGLRDFDSGLVIIANKLREATQSENVVITLGSEGLLIHRAEDVGASTWHTDQLRAFNSSPRDSAGAGDSFLTTATLALISGADIWKSTYLGSIAAAIQVSRVGNIPLSPAELIRELED